jgi:hypothetical protein
MLKTGANFSEPIFWSRETIGCMAQLPAATFRGLPKPGDTDNNLLRKIDEILSTGLGVGGVDWVTDTAVHTGDWWVFHAVTDCVIGAITYKAGTSTGSPVGLTIKGGDRLYGNIISLTLASGDGELYRAV